MGLLSGLMGTTSEIEVAEVVDEFEPILAEGEWIDTVYRLVHDFFVFTNKRLIFVDKESFSGKEMAYRSIPYRSIRHFSIEAAGALDLDAELEIRVAGAPAPIRKAFGKKLSVYEVQRVLARYVLE